jgi:hypothetical protein
MSVELTNPSKGGEAPPSYRPDLPPRPSVTNPNSSTVDGAGYPTTSSHPPSSFDDPYVVARRDTPCRYFWYRWINPWVRMLLIIVILYLYAMSSGVLTYRNNDFQDQMQRLVNPGQEKDTTHPSPGDPTSTYPEREYGYLNYYSGAYVPFILRDLWFDFIPALQGNTRDPWKSFVDATPIIWNVVMLLMLVVRRDIVRWSEYLAIQMILFSVNALVHVSTTYPDAGGYQDSCLDPDKHVAGTWMWHYITTAYCGDMMWSGHTQETLLPLIMIRRLMWDWCGWNLSWGGVEKVNRSDLINHHPWIFSGYHNDKERNEVDYTILTPSLVTRSIHTLEA